MGGAGLIGQKLERQKSVRQINWSKKRSKSVGRNSEGKPWNAFDCLIFFTEKVKMAKVEGTYTSVKNQEFVDFYVHLGENFLKVKTFFLSFLFDIFPINWA